MTNTCLRSISHDIVDVINSATTSIQCHAKIKTSAPFLFHTINHPLSPSATTYFYVKFLQIDPRMYATPFGHWIRVKISTQPPQTRKNNSNWRIRHRDIIPALISSISLSLSFPKASFHETKFMSLRIIFPPFALSTSSSPTKILFSPSLHFSRRRRRRMRSRSNTIQSLAHFSSDNR